MIFIRNFNRNFNSLTLNKIIQQKIEIQNRMNAARLECEEAKKDKKQEIFLRKEHEQKNQVVIL